MWSISGHPIGDKLTLYIKNYIINNYSEGIIFNNEHDRLRECKQIANEIAEKIILI